MLVIIFAGSPLTAQSLISRGLAHPVVCHALLRAKSRAPIEDQNRSARVAIRDVLHRLMTAHGLKNNDAFASIGGFTAPNFFGLIASFDVLAHLRDLDADLYQDNPKLTHVSFELRGRAEINSYLSAVEFYARQIQTEILKRKRAQYPRIRVTTFIESFIPIALTLDLFARPPMSLAALLEQGSILLAFGTMLEAGVRLNPITQRQFNLYKQIKFITRVLRAAPLEDERVSLTAGMFDAPDEFQHNVLQTGGDGPLNATAEASFPSLVTSLDRGLDSIREHTRDIPNVPPTIPRQIYYDSLFFVDQTEPVWVITYRAYREPPHSNLRYPQDEESDEPQSFAFGTRALKPIPVPVKVKR